MEKTAKPRVFSGIQPSGNLHIGNYLGAISQWIGMQAEYECVFCVVDYHAITVRQNPKALRKKIIEVAKLYLASGIDPTKAVVFKQSDVSQHTELAWILNTITRMSDLNKMTQFKEKADGIEKESVGIGLFDYPVLMASDILLYNTEVVPVGEDQAQHVELARDLGRRFNSQFGQVFTIPKVKIIKTAARIMGLDDPAKKMSKSARSEYNYIALTDAPEAAARKISRAVTDSGKEVIFDPQKKPAISNLMNIYSLFAGISVNELEKRYQGRGYGDFKQDLAFEIKRFLEEFGKRYNKISDRDVARILAEGAEKVKPIARETLYKVKEKIGVI